MTTVRQQMIELLREEELDAMELSQVLSIPEKEVYEHLPHLVRTLGSSREKLIISPYLCLKCNYSFAGRTRFDRPGRCPRCKHTHIRMATYTIR